MYEHFHRPDLYPSRLPGFVGALIFLVYGGIWGLFPDLDHPLALLAKGLPLTFENLVTQAGRDFHLPGIVFVGACFVLGNTFILGWFLTKCR